MPIYSWPSLKTPLYHAPLIYDFLFLEHTATVVILHHPFHIHCLFMYLSQRLPGVYLIDSDESFNQVMSLNHTVTPILLFHPQMITPDFTIDPIFTIYTDSIFIANRFEPFHRVNFLTDPQHFSGEHQLSLCKAMSINKPAHFLPATQSLEIRSSRHHSKAGQRVSFFFPSAPRVVYSTFLNSAKHFETLDESLGSVLNWLENSLCGSRSAVLPDLPIFDIIDYDYVMAIKPLRATYFYTYFADGLRSMSNSINDSNLHITSSWISLINKLLITVASAAPAHPEELFREFNIDRNAALSQSIWEKVAEAVTVSSQTTLHCPLATFLWPQIDKEFIKYTVEGINNIAKDFQKGKGKFHYFVLSHHSKYVLEALKEGFIFEGHLAMDVKAHCYSRSFDAVMVQIINEKGAKDLSFHHLCFLDGDNFNIVPQVYFPEKMFNSGCRRKCRNLVLTFDEDLPAKDFIRNGKNDIFIGFDGHSTIKSFHDTQIHTIDLNILLNNNKYPLGIVCIFANLPHERLLSINIKEGYTDLYELISQSNSVMCEDSTLVPEMALGEAYFDALNLIYAHSKLVLHNTTNKDYSLQITSNPVRLNSSTTDPAQFGCKTVISKGDDTRVYYSHANKKGDTERVTLTRAILDLSGQETIILGSRLIQDLMACITKHTIQYPEKDFDVWIVKEIREHWKFIQDYFNKNNVLDVPACLINGVEENLVSLIEKNISNNLTGE